MLVKTVAMSKESAAETLDKHATWMNPPDWFNVLEGIWQCHQWLLALKVHRWIQMQKWYKADNWYYSKLISIMGKERQYRMAMDMFKEMKKIGCHPDTSLYNSIMIDFLHGKDKEEGLAKAFSLLEEMKLKCRCQPNIVTYNILTKAVAQMGDQEKVNALLKEIFNHDLSLDHFTFNRVMDAYGKDGKVVLMEATFKQMRDEKLKPDLITFNTLIDSYGKAREFEKMEQVLWSMTLRRTPPILLVVKTFNSVITNYGNARLVEKFESIFREMKKMNVSPSFVTYKTLIGAYGQCYEMDKMRSCVKKMESAGFKPRSLMLNKMLEKYCSHGMTSKVEDLLNDSMAKFGMAAIWLSYAIVIHAHKKLGSRSQMQALLDKMKIAGIKPTKETYFDIMELIGIKVDYQKGHLSSSAASLQRDFDPLCCLRLHALGIASTTHNLRLTTIFHSFLSVKIIVLLHGFLHCCNVLKIFMLS